MSESTMSSTSVQSNTDTIYSDEDALQGPRGGMPPPQTTSNTHRITTLLSRRQPVMVVICGSYEWEPPVTAIPVESDKDIFPVLRQLTTASLALVNPEDIKIPYLLSVAELIHINVFLLAVDINHEASGVARSLTAHLPLINQMDFETVISYSKADVVSDDLSNDAAGDQSVLFDLDDGEGE